MSSTSSEVKMLILSAIGVSKASDTDAARLAVLANLIASDDFTLEEVWRALIKNPDTDISAKFTSEMFVKAIERNVIHRPNFIQQLLDLPYDNNGVKEFKTIIDILKLFLDTTITLPVDSIDLYTAFTEGLVAAIVGGVSYPAFAPIYNPSQISSNELFKLLLLYNKIKTDGSLGTLNDKKAKLDALIIQDGNTRFFEIDDEASYYTTAAGTGAGNFGEPATYANYIDTTKIVSVVYDMFVLRSSLTDSTVLKNYFNWQIFVIKNKDVSNLQTIFSTTISEALVYAFIIKDTSTNFWAHPTTGAIDSYAKFLVLRTIGYDYNEIIRNNYTDIIPDTTRTSNFKRVFPEFMDSTILNRMDAYTSSSLLAANKLVEFLKSSDTIISIYDAVNALPSSTQKSRFIGLASPGIAVKGGQSISSTNQDKLNIILAIVKHAPSDVNDFISGLLYISDNVGIIAEMFYISNNTVQEKLNNYNTVNEIGDFATYTSTNQDLILKRLTNNDTVAIVAILLANTDNRVTDTSSFSSILTKYKAASIFANGLRNNYSFSDITQLQSGNWSAGLKPVTLLIMSYFGLFNGSAVNNGRTNVNGLKTFITDNLLNDISVFKAAFENLPLIDPGAGDNITIGNNTYYSSSAGGSPKLDLKLHFLDILVANSISLSFWSSIDTNFARAIQYLTDYSESTFERSALCIPLFREIGVTRLNSEFGFSEFTNGNLLSNWPIAFALSDFENFVEDPSALLTWKKTMYIIDSHGVKGDQKEVLLFSPSEIRRAFELTLPQLRFIFESKGYILADDFLDATDSSGYTSASTAPLQGGRVLA
jgi:hypothetical protein